MKNTISLCLASSIFAVIGCGSQSSKKIFPLEAADLQSELAALASNEALSAAAAGDGNGSSALSLALANESSPYKSLTRSCEAQADGTAKVTITSESNFEKDLSNARISRSQKVSGSGTQTRLWSKVDGTPVTCSSDGQHANIGWNADLSGVNLKVNIQRTQLATMTQTNIKKNLTTSRSRSSSLVAERNVTFVSFTNNGTQIVQTKNVSGQSTRSFKFIDKNGQEQSGSLSTEGSIQVKITRLAATNSLVSREVVSGERTSTGADGSKVQATYTNFVVTGEGESCSAESGTLVLKYTSATGTIAQTLTCSPESGALNCTDSSNSTVEIESPTCDPLDAK